MSKAIDLYVVIERSIFDTDRQWIGALSELAGLDVPRLGLQVRTKSEPPERSAALAREARTATQGSAVPVLLNGTAGQALELGYEGVQWPEAQFPARYEPLRLLRGASVHSPEAAMKAEAAGADFVVAGTVFDAGSKPAAGAGREALSRIASATSLPALAIGGVTPDRVTLCVEAGASGVAVVTSVLCAPNMAAAVRDLREALDAARAAERSG